MPQELVHVRSFALAVISDIVSLDRSLSSSIYKLLISADTLNPSTVVESFDAKGV